MKRKNVSWQKYFIFILLIPFSLAVIRLIAFQAGEEFLVGTYLFSDQHHSDIAMDEKGNFVITWEGSGQEEGSGIFARRFNNKGQPISKEFHVNTFATPGAEQYPAIAMDRRGNFVIAWFIHGPDGSMRGVFARRFNKKGEPIGKEFLVNTHTMGSQDMPSIAMDKKGNFVITWNSYAQDGSASGVFAQRYNRKGETVGEEFQVNTYASSDQRHSDIEMDEKGNFVITWSSYGRDSSAWGIFAQMYNRKGQPIGFEFQVNTYTKWYQWHPAIAMDEKGNFVITWSSVGQDGSTDGVFAQMYNRKGKAIGEEFQVNTYTEGKQCSPAVGMDSKRNFAITWDSLRQDGSKEGVFAQRFNRKGQPIGFEFQVNTYTNNEQWHPVIAMDEKGNFVITWESYGQDGSGWGVIGKMFQK